MIEPLVVRKPVKCLNLSKNNTKVWTREEGTILGDPNREPWKTLIVKGFLRQTTSKDFSKKGIIKKSEERASYVGDLKKYSSQNAERGADLMWYYVSASQKLAGWKDSDIQALADDISSLSQAVNLNLSFKEFKRNEVSQAIRREKLDWLLADPENNIWVKGIPNSMTPLNILGVFHYLVDRISGWQLADKEGFGFIKLARIILEGKSNISHTDFLKAEAK